MLRNYLYVVIAITSLFALLALVWYVDRLSQPGPLDSAPRFFVKALEAYESWDKTCDAPEDGRRAEVTGGVRLLREDALRCAFKWQMSDRDWGALEEAEQIEIAPLIAGLYIMTRDEKWKRFDMCELDQSSRRVAFARSAEYESYVEESVQIDIWLGQIGKSLPEDWYDVRSSFRECPCDFDLACRLARYED